jgi:ferredoxin
VTQGGWRPDGTLASGKEGGCGCRSVWDDACDLTGGGTGWAWKPGVWDTPEMPPGAQPVTGLASQRPALTMEQAMKAAYEMEDNGQVKISPNTAQITGTCNCCPDCCVIIWPMKTYGNVYQMLAPSRFRAVIDESKCTGCQTCVDRCHFDAIEMKKVAGAKKMKAFMINEHCMGCGLCIYKCEGTAMHLELVRPAEHIPTTKFGSPGANQQAQAQMAQAELKKKGMPDQGQM